VRQTLVFNFSALLCLTTACQRPSRETSSVSVRDSAGIRIVTTSIPEIPKRWVLSTSPAIDISSALDSAPFVSWWGSVRRLSNGNLALIPMVYRPAGTMVFPSSVIVLDSTGRVVRRIGRKGSGPGEFSSITKFLVLPGDSLLIYDSDEQTASVMDVNGVFQHRMPMKEPIARFADGSLVTLGSIRAAGPIAPRDPNRVIKLTYERIRPDGALLETIAEQIAMPDKAEDHAACVVHPSVACGDSLLYQTGGSTFEVRSYTRNGSADRIIRLDLSPRRATPADAELFKMRQRQSARAAGAPPPDFRGYNFPEFLPAIDRLIISADGDIWVGPGSAWALDPIDWIVLAPDGRFRAQVLVPANFTVQEIGHDYLLGGFIDSDENRSVRMYKFRR
jgi:hypothetical protein